MPNAALELRHLRGVDSVTYSGYRTEESAKVVLSWDIFRGGQDSWKRVEMAERMIESTQREARLQRDAFESIDKAWSARTITNDRIAALTREAEAARKVVAAYTKEYELGQRTLIDLLNAENGLFNTYVQLISARGVAVFADYQLLAAMGQLLDYLKTAPPPEAEPNHATPFLFPTKIPPILINPPGPGPEPLKTRSDATEFAPSSPKALKVADRWPNWTVPVDGDAMARWMPARHPDAATASVEKAAREDNAQRHSSALSYAADVLKAPARWPIKNAD
jgi:adhesin transport system outer membrane protein